MPFTPTYRSVHNEGCDITYWFQGTGPLLLMVPGGPGIGSTYNPIFEHLDHQYTVCTFDRRQAARSRTTPKRTMNPAQHARDMAAIVKDLGFTKTNLFGNSGGGILALQFAVDHPDMLDRIISHEAPTASLLSDAPAVYDRLYSIMARYEDESPSAAYSDFRSMLTGYEGFPARVTAESPDVENFFGRDIIVFVLYCPDLRRIVKNGVKIAVGSGQLSGDVWYARATLEQKEVLGCEHHVFPGNHSAFELEPEVFAKKLLSVLDELAK